MERLTEYIEREAAVREILGLTIVDDAVAAYADAVLYRIQHIPAAEVEAAVRGRWIDIPKGFVCVSSEDGFYSGHATSCSVCEEVNPNAFKTNYCPNCGAKMDGVNKC